MLDDGNRGYRPKETICVWRTQEIADSVINCARKRHFSDGGIQIER